MRLMAFVIKTVRRIVKRIVMNTCQEGDKAAELPEDKDGVKSGDKDGFKDGDKAGDKDGDKDGVISSSHRNPWKSLK